MIGRSGHDVEQVSGAGAAVEALTVGPRLALVAFVADDRVVSLVSDVRGHPEAIVSAVPVLVVTDDEAMVKTATGAGADATLIRPFHADELADELAAVLARSPEERAEAREAAAGGDD